MIYYVKGDATKPNKLNNENRVIVHICNNKGGWGSGFVLCLSSRWPEPERRYREWVNSMSPTDLNNGDLPLGKIQIVPVKDEQGKLFVCNMVAQNGYVTKDNPVAVDYVALHNCLVKLNDWMKKYEEVRKLLVYPNRPENFSVHMPRIGCGLAGGTWDMVEFIIKTTLTYNVNVYDLE